MDVTVIDQRPRPDDVSIVRGEFYEIYFGVAGSPTMSMRVGGAKGNRVRVLVGVDSWERKH